MLSRGQGKPFEAWHGSFNCSNQRLRCRCCAPYGGAPSCRDQGTDCGAVRVDHSGFVPIAWALPSIRERQINLEPVPVPDKAVAVSSNGYAAHKDAPFVAERESLLYVTDASGTERLDVHLLSRLQGRAHGPV